MRVVFAYSFPHKKTYDGLMSLLTHGLVPDLVVAAGFKKLNIKHSPTRVSPQGLDFPVASVVCERFGIEYLEADHDSQDLARQLTESRARSGIILGARILKPHVISPFEKGILNLHPGVLPHNRGLDNLKWAITNRLPQGVTSHIIDPAIDRGRLIEKAIVDVYEDDSLLDVALRIQNTEMKLLPRAVAAMESGDTADFEVLGEGEYNTSMTADLDVRMIEQFPQYKRDYSAITAAYVRQQASRH